MLDEGDSAGLLQDSLENHCISETEKCDSCNKYINTDMQF